MLYLAWLGDSQACLVRDGHALCIMNPHKPERQVDRLEVKYTSPLIYKNTKYVNDKFTLWKCMGFKSEVYFSAIYMNAFELHFSLTLLLNLIYKIWYNRLINDSLKVHKLCLFLYSKNNINQNFSGWEKSYRSSRWSCSVHGNMARQWQSGRVKGNR